MHAVSKLGHEVTTNREKQDGMAGYMADGVCVQIKQTLTNCLAREHLTDYKVGEWGGDGEGLSCVD